MRQALYREYRPKTFDQVIGQDAVVAVLKNQIKTKTPSHAYVFSGTRGTGKTSCAKVFSRAVNCLHSIDGNPCNVCENCRAILEETTLDVVEMDAASNRRIDDMRELRDNVVYLPSKLKYKVYIIDEAHMITNEGFNALLKTLEEPPEHLIFILATTEPEKIPATILSRCQRHEFLRIDEKLIEKHLEEVAKSLKIEYTKEALAYIARRSGGGMRDALSAMDQALSTGKLDIKAVEEIYGGVDQTILFQLSLALKEKNAQEALTIFRDITLSGKNMSSFLKDLIAHYRLLMWAKSEGGLWPYTMNQTEMDAYRKYAQALSLDSIFFAMEELFQAEDRLRFTEEENTVLEMTLLKILNQSSDKSLIQRVAALEEKTGSLALWKKQHPQEEEKKAFDEIRKEDLVKALPKEEKLQKVENKEEDMGEGSQEEEKMPFAQNVKKEITGDIKNKTFSKIDEKDFLAIWKDVLEMAKKEHPALYSLLEEGKLNKIEDNRVEMNFLPGSFAYALLRKEERKDKLEQIFSQVMHKSITLILKEEEISIEQKLQDFFGDLLIMKGEQS